LPIDPSRQHPSTNIEQEDKFTDGEWFVNWHGHPDSGKIQIGSGKDYVCEMYHNPDDETNEEENERQTKANAALIAQAKNMYYALKDVVSDLFIQVENKHGAQVAASYPSIEKAKEILLKANPKK